MDSIAARRAFARTWLRTTAGPEPRKLGAFTLRPAQARAVERIRAAFAEFGGALLADPPGTGKTIIALAVAAAERADPPRPDEAQEAALVLAPAALRAQWERAAGRARVPIRFVSLESMSRGNAVEAQRFVIVDEAHHVRTPTARRYAGVAGACAGAHVLLLTATPVVNRRADRDALLALFLGAAAATLDESALARCIVRRAAADDDAGGGRPRVHRLPPLGPPAGAPVDVGQAVSRSLMALPPPFPTADGSGALTLVRVSLAMAWSSSLAALDAALRRRVQRGDALADALRTGRWPTRAALRRWIVGDDTTQLMLSELDPADDRVPADALTMLHAHLAAVRSLRAVIAPHIAADAAARAAALRALLRAHPSRRMVVFASHAATIRALWNAMRADAGVVAVTGARNGGTVRAAAGRWSRDEVLRALGPHAPPLPRTDRPNDPAHRRAIRVLLTTDMLAEGIELQGVGILVHADLPWTPARLEQREGRITRLAAAASTLRAGRDPDDVFITRFRAPAAATAMLRLAARLRRKQAVRTHAVLAADSRAEIETTMRAWAAPAVQPLTARLPVPAGDPPAGARAFLALVRIDAGHRLVAGQRGTRWKVSTAPHAVLAATRYAAALRRPDPAESRDARRALARWARRSAARALIGPGRDMRTPLRRRLHDFTDRILRATPLALRARRGADLGALVRAVSAANGAGVERQLARVLRPTITDDAVEAALRAIAAQAVHGSRPGTPRATLMALLVAPGPGTPGVATPAAARPPATPRRARTSASR